MAVVAERGVCFSMFLDNGMPARALIFSRELKAVGLLGRFSYMVTNLESAVSSNDELVIVLSYEYDRQNEYDFRPILGQMLDLEHILDNFFSFTDDDVKCDFIRRIKFVLRCHNDDDLSPEWISAHMDGAQMLSKAVFSNKAEERVRRLIQICGKIVTQRDFIAMLLKKEDDYDVSLASILVRLSCLSYNLIDVNFSRALFAGKISKDKLHNFLFMTSIPDRCLLCVLCKQTSFNANFRIGSRVVEGNYIIGEGAHINNVSDFVSASRRTCGVITDVGHVVSIRATDKAVEIVEDRMIIWAFRIFRSILHSGEPSNDCKNLFSIMNHFVMGSRVTRLTINMLWFVSKIMEDTLFLINNPPNSGKSWYSLSCCLSLFVEYVDMRSASSCDVASFVNAIVNRFSLELIHTAR